MSICESSEGWDRTFLDLSSKLAEPFCSVYEQLRYRLLAPLDPNKFDNSINQTQEIATRTLIGAGAIFGAFLCTSFFIPAFCGIALLGAGCKLLRAIGFAIQKDGFTHVRGQAPEKALDPEDQQIKVATWNLCGIGGGMALDHGGVTHWRTRLDGVIDKINWEDPDVLILQEIYDTALAEAIVEKLQNRYAHFFMHLGPNVNGMGSGVMILSKYPVHSFSNESFANNDWSLNRGISTLEIKARPEDSQPCARIIGTHLINGYEAVDREKRAVQVAQIVDGLAKKTLALPTVIAGDFNMERDKEGKTLLDFLHPGFQEAEPTRTNRLMVQWNGKVDCEWEETIDYLSLFRRTLADGRQIAAIDENIRLENVHLIEAFDSTYNTKTALSDHHGIAGILKLGSRN